MAFEHEKRHSSGFESDQPPERGRNSPPHTSASETDRRRRSSERTFHNAIAIPQHARGTARYYSVLGSSDRRFESLLRSRCLGMALEYGCGQGGWTLSFSEAIPKIVGFDISDKAIERARHRATIKGVRNVEFTVGDGENLGFASASFDTVYGVAILHHLDLPSALREIARVLKPNGVAVFYEPLGHNPAINLYRKLTPDIRTPDEHPLRLPDFRLAQKYFGHVNWEPFCLMTAAAVLLRKTPWFERAVRLLDRLDRTIFHVAFTRRFAWTSVITLSAPRPA